MLLFLATLLAAAAAGFGEAEVCIAQGARFKFPFEGKAPPRKSQRGVNDLTLCRIYRDKTCCTASHTGQAVATLKNLALSGEANSQCLELWEALECSICDPRVGTSSGTPVLCQAFCESVYNACSSAFFAMDAKQVLMPCGSTEIICAQGRQWTTNSSYFCELAGFRVGNLQESSFCYDGSVDQDSEDSTRPSYKKSKKNNVAKASRTSTKKAFNRVRKLLMTDNVLWAIGGLVLTAGALYFRQRGIRSKQRRIALMKTIHEARARQQAAVTASAAGKMTKNKS